MNIINSLAINDSIGMYYENDNIEVFYNIYENANIELQLNVKNDELFELNKIEAIIRKINAKVFKDVFATLKRIFNKLAYNFVNFHSFDKNMTE